MCDFIVGHLSQQVRDIFSKENSYQWDEQLLYLHFIYSAYTRQDKCSGTFFNTIKASAMWTSQGSSILSQYFAKIKTPLEFSWSVPSLTVMSVFACPKSFFFYFSPFTSSFANPPPHITSPTLSITRSISPVFCKQLVSRKLAHFVCAFWRMGWPLLYFMPIIQKDHGPLQFGLVDGPWRGNMRVFDESGQTFPPGRRRRKRGEGNEPIVYVKVA